MDVLRIHAILHALEQSGITIQPGLNLQEIKRVEAAGSISIPPDLRKLLSLGLPVSEGFPDWRRLSSAEITEAINAPIRDLEQSIRNQELWMPTWGERPRDFDAAASMAIGILKAAPRLMPVYLHRYIPCEPTSRGNPVFSVYATDIAYYGNSLAQYFDAEFFGARLANQSNNPKYIPFWSDVAM